MDSGYSSKPLTDKLGLKRGMQALFADAPDGYVESLETAGVVVLSRLSKDFDFAQVFTTQRDHLASLLQSLRPLMHSSSIVWVSWPKQGAANKMLAMLSNITEDVIRDIALPMGLVDVKVCAIDDVWSGLKLVIRKELR